MENCCLHSAKGHANLSEVDEDEAVDEAMSLNEEFGGDRRHEVAAELLSCLLRFTLLSLSGVCDGALDALCKALLYNWRNC